MTAAQKVVAGQALEIAVELIDRSKTNPSSRGTQGLEELKASIKAQGIRVPLQVFQVGKRYELDDGEGRWTVAKELKLKTVPCIVVKKPANTALDQLIKGSTQRKLSPWQQAELIGHCLGAKIKQKEIADAVGKSEGWVSRFKTIWECGKKADTMTRANLDGKMETRPYVKRRDGGFKAYFADYTSMDDLYADCQVMLNPEKAEKPKSTPPRAPAEDGDGGEQLDLVSAAERKQLEEIEDELAQALEIPVEKIKATMHEEGGIWIQIRLSDLKTAQTAIGRIALPWKSDTKS